MNRLPRALITLATASAFAVCARAQTPEPRVVYEREARGAERGAPEVAEDPAAEKARLKFEGLRFLRERDALRLLREEVKGMGDTFVYAPARVENAVRVLKKFYAARGFVDAAFEVREEAAAAHRLVTLVVSEGGRARLEEVRFEGGGRVPAARLAGATEKCLARMAGDETDWRDVYDEARLDYCVRDAWRVLRGEGFLEAKTGEPKVEANERGLRATVRVEEGTRYRYGRIKVKGVTAFLPEQVVEMLDARAGELADGEKVTQALSEHLTEEYGDRGYLQYSYDVTPTYRATPGRKGWGVVDLKIEITEGACFTLSSISFDGNRLKTEAELRGMLSMREGDVFSRRRFRDGLERLYRAGALGARRDRPFDHWQNVEATLDEEKGLIAIRIMVDESDL